MSGPPIRVLIADDEAVLRAALADLVQSDDSFELVDSARDADEAIAMAEAMKPDVALVDVRMPAGGGPRVAEELRRLLPADARARPQCRERPGLGRADARGAVPSDTS